MTLPRGCKKQWRSKWNFFRVFSWKNSCCTVLEALFTTLFCHCRTPIPSSRGNPADSSQLESTKFQDLAKAHGAVQVLWIPGYAGIPGNEEADGLAKAGCLLPEPPGAVSSPAHLRRLARQQPRDAFKAWWTTEAPESYKPLNLEVTTSCPPELTLPRATLHSV